MKSKQKRVFASIATCISCLALAAFCFGCSPQTQPNEKSPEGQDSKEASTEPVSIQWSPETDCSLCHIKEAKSESDTACDASQHSTMECMDCHTDESQLSKMHEGATTADRAPTRLKKTGIDMDGCLSCHAQSEIAEKSSASTALTDLNGLTVNPHAIPETPSHGDITCSDCHEMHSDASERTEDAQKLCRSCHHSDVYECYTCHQHG